VTYQLSATVIPSGGGTVTSEPPGIECPGDCVEFYAFGTEVVLSAHPATGYVFIGWTGCDVSATNECRISMHSARNVTAHFALGFYELSVTKTGKGEGLLWSSPPGITCGPDCFERYTSGTLVTLTAAPSVNSIFEGWGGDCSPCGLNSQCAIFVDNDKNCSAAFTLIQYRVTASSTGSGYGNVSSTPAGISFRHPLATSGSSNFEAGTTVVLSAQAGPHSTASWSSCPGGAVSGNGSGLATCTFSSLDGDKNALVSFDLENYEVSVSVLPPGGGTVTSDPPGIDCPENCTAPYPYGTEVSLKALPSAGYVFLGWEGCDGATEDQCSVTVTGPKGVTARFQEGFSLKVIRSPSGGGEVIMNPPGGTYLPGTEVILTAVASHGFVFRGWQWDAQGTSPSISVLMDRDKDIIAQFVSTDTVEKSAALPGGGTLEDYLMVSAPVLPANGDPLHVFGGEDHYDPTVLRLFRWDNAFGGYAEYPAIPQVDLGIGYWHISARPKTLTIAGNTIPYGTDYAILLEPGWNQIGCPFPEGPTAWSQTLVYPGRGREASPISSSSNKWVENALWAYREGVYELRDSLVPWGGYWVNNVSGEKVALIVGSAPHALAEPKARDSSGKTGISLSLKYGNKVDRSIFLGLDPEASSASDHLDCQAPPPVSEDMVRIYVDNSDWESRPGNYAVDFRPWRGEAIEFPLVIEVPEGWTKSLVLSWQGLKSLPKGIEAKLIDPQKGPKEFKMRGKRAYKIVPEKGKRLYRLKVIMAPSGR